MKKRTNSYIKNFWIGNKESFEQIVLRHKDKLIYFIYKYVRSIDIAEDIAQDVYVYLLIHKENYDFEYSLKTYLFTIGKTKALNYLKREQRITQIDEKDIQDLDTLEERVFLDERKQNLKQAILKLNPDYQQAVYLADIEELNYAEIGQILQKSESGIKVLIHRARKSLESIVKSEEQKFES